MSVTMCIKHGIWIFDGEGCFECWKIKNNDRILKKGQKFTMGEAINIAPTEADNGHKSKRSN